MPTSDASDVLAEILELLTPVLRDAFYALISDVRNKVVLQAVADAIAEGDLEKAFLALGLNQQSMRPMMRVVEAAFEVGGIYTGKTFPKYMETSVGKVAFRFDVRNSRAEAWLRDWSSTKVREIQDETRLLIREVVERGMREGQNPRTIAVDLVGRYDSTTGQRIGGAVGLTNYQESWISRARAELANLDPNYLKRTLRDKRFDSVVTRAIRDGKPLSADQIDKLILRYRDGVLKYRGDTIARTEMIAALNRSEWEAVMQAVDLGALKKSDTRRVWDSTGPDGRTRLTHLMMEGQTVEIDEPFIFPSVMLGVPGGKAMFPGDTSLGAPARETIQCRCKARTKVDWLADVRKVKLTDEDRAAIRALATAKLPGE